MYGYEYDAETYPFLFLRILKFLHMRKPEITEQALKSYEELDEDYIFILVDELLWSLFEDVSFDFDETVEMTTVYFSDPVVDRLFALASNQKDNHGSLSNAWRRKIQDISEFYLAGPTYSVYSLEHHFSPRGVAFEVVQSPDCYEPLLFANSVIDMLLRFQWELEQLERTLEDRKVLTIDFTREEAA